MRLRSHHDETKIRTACLPRLLATFFLAVSSSCWLTSICAAQKGPNTYTIPTPSPTDYSKLQWLIGDWSGMTVGKGSQGKVLLSASYALGKRFIILREQLSLPATKTAPATEERLMGILSGGASRSGYDLVLYSSNGFVTRYEVSINTGTIVFNPEGGLAPPPGWLFRRAIRETNHDQCVETVDVAPPGQPFFNYYTANLSNVNSGAAASKTSSPQRAKNRRFLFWHRRN
jgi:hypothetical protein